ncbi:unnamed protein product [Pleuronectes platessa]|uniref:Uncharacterized protein n=1 Tax=Pleuronectes platessa TaxID=8262 RepID=A0A9N7U353_PLEPL|nr:unnamed protein product [Pleuronectes platessa]
MPPVYFQISKALPCPQRGNGSSAAVLIGNLQSREVMVKVSNTSSFQVLRSKLLPHLGPKQRNLHSQRGKRSCGVTNCPNEAGADDESISQDLIQLFLHLALQHLGPGDSLWSSIGAIQALAMTEQ